MCNSRIYSFSSRDQTASVTALSEHNIYNKKVLVKILRGIQFQINLSSLVFYEDTNHQITLNVPINLSHFSKVTMWLGCLLSDESIRTRA
jgi:hypothetical protein